MTIDMAAIESTLPTPVDELVRELGYRGVPVHIRASNRQLLAALGDDVDKEVLRQALRWRKLEECEACRTRTGRHTEPSDVRADRFTPGVRAGR